MRYMLDTDICSYILRKRPARILETMQTGIEAGHHICISAITYAELRLGAERSQAGIKYHRLIDGFCERLNLIAPWDAAAADAFAQLQKHLLSKGTPIGTNDAMIAAHALSIRAVVVTNNHRHFSKVPKLKLTNWAM